MKRTLLVLAFSLFTTFAHAQCNGIFPPQTVCGNAGGSSNLPAAISPGAFQGSASGLNGQIQYNNNGVLGGLTDAQVTARIAVFSAIANGATPASGGGTANFLRADGTWAAPPSNTSNAAQFGITCNGVTDDGPAFITAFNALNGAPLILPAGTCRIATTAFYNKWIASGSGLLTAPGPKIIGQGRYVTNIEADVANGYAIAINPDWAALHKSMFILTPGTSGALASNTYFIQTTVTTPQGDEINVSPAKSAGIVTGPSGSIAMTLQPLNSGYCYNIYIGTSSTPANYARVAGVDAICLGAGAVTITAIGTAHAVPTNKVAIWQETGISSLSILNSTPTSQASGVLWFRVGYSTISDVYMRELSKDGLVIPNWTGDNDGSFVVTVDKSKFQSIQGWCLNAAGNTLEFSNFTVSNSVFDQCGNNPTNLNANFTMSAITNASPGVVTTVGSHTLQFGDQIFISGVTGMALPTIFYRVCGTVTATQFALCDLNGNNFNTTSLGAYTPNSGVEQLAWRPPAVNSSGDLTQSGAIAYTGLIGNFINIGFTQNRNVSIYLTEVGSNDNITIQSTDFENTFGKGLYAASVINLHMFNNECLTTVGVGTTISCAQFGTGLNRGNVINVNVDGMKVRSNVSGTFANGFEQLSGAGGLIFRETIQISNVYWQTFLGAVKYFGFSGNPFSFFWARLDGATGATCTIEGSFNIASCVRNSTGSYTITFIKPSLNAIYSVSGTATRIGTNPGIIFISNKAAMAPNTLSFLCVNASGLTAMDCDIMNLVGFGDPQ